MEQEIEIQWRKYAPVLILVAILIGVLLYSNLNESTNSPTGAILLDLATLGERTDFQYHFNTQTGDLVKKPEIGHFASDGRDGRSIVAIDNEGTSRAVFIFDVETGAHERFAPGDITQKLLPVLSPDRTRVAYTVYPNDIKELQRPSGWSIFVAKRGENPEAVAFGTDPHWSPDGRLILFIADDGLNLFDTERRQQYTAWQLNDAAANVAMKMDVSQDGKMLAWSNPWNNEIVIAQIESWDPFNAAVIRRIETQAFWPTFSPDGSWLAYEEVEWGKPNDNPRLMLYHIPTEKTVFAADLSEYDQEQMFITDWIQM